MQHYYNVNGQNKRIDPSLLIEIKIFAGISITDLYQDGQHIYQKLGVYSHVVHYRFIGRVVNKKVQLKCNGYHSSADDHHTIYCPRYISEKELKKSSFWKSNMKIYCDKCTVEIHERPERDYAASTLKDLAQHKDITTVRKIISLVDSKYKRSGWLFESIDPEDLRLKWIIERADRKQKSG